MFRSTSNFDKLLEKATSNLRLEPDWPIILQICDLIRQGDVQPKYALGAIKKKLYSANPHSAMFALLVLESCMKNCGHLIHDEVGTKQYMEQLRELVKTTGHENVKNKVLELLQAWAYAFRNSPKYRAVQDTLNIMKSEGYKFPVLKESDAMFSADTAPEWADGDVCHRCRVQFGMVQRKHHCRACGQVFCAQCSSKTSTLPKFGFEKEVRVCDACFDSLNKPTSAGQKAEGSGEAPQEYTSSALTQQSQKGRNRNDSKNTPRPGTSRDASRSGGPRRAGSSSRSNTPTRSNVQNQYTPPNRGKTEEELREEEELQLALALSKSEAEHKEKEKKRTTSAIMSNAAAATRAKQASPPPVRSSTPELQDEDMDPELARYLNRSYWEKRQSEDRSKTSPLQSVQAERHSPTIQQPSAPITISSPQATASSQPLRRHENGEADLEIEDFVTNLKSQLEIFVNRMKSNSSRGRSIANDSSVQTLFMNITAMHSKLLRYIQQQDDKRVYYEGLQDKMAQVKDARAALDALREEHREKLRRQAEEAERIRQMQMAHKLEIMRKKKQEYLQYQRQLALQRIQEQEREMQMRQEQQKQQYLMGSMQGPPMQGPMGPPGSMPYSMPYMPQAGQMPPNFPESGQFPSLPPPGPSFSSMPPGGPSSGPGTPGGPGGPGPGGPGPFPQFSQSNGGMPPPSASNAVSGSMASLQRASQASLHGQMPPHMLPPIAMPLHGIAMRPPGPQGPPPPGQGPPPQGPVGPPQGPIPMGYPGHGMPPGPQGPAPGSPQQPPPAQQPQQPPQQQQGSSAEAPQTEELIRFD